MQRITLFLTLLFMLAGPLLLPAAGEEQPVNGAEETLEREAYEKSMEERLGELGAQLDALREKANVAAEEATAQLKEQLADTEELRQEAVLKLQELERASRDSWEKFSAELDKAAKDFEQAFDRVRSGKK